MHMTGLEKEGAYRGKTGPDIPAGINTDGRACSSRSSRHG